MRSSEVNSVDFTIQVHLGANLELIRPVSTAILTSPAFVWTIGEEIARASKDIQEEIGDIPPLKAQVTVFDEAGSVWQSPLTELVLSIPVDVSVEEARYHSLTCPQSVFDQLITGHKYYWQLALTYPVLDYSGICKEQTLSQKAAFSVVRSQEKEILESMLANLRSQDKKQIGNILLCGAIYEAFALYEEAISVYQQPLAEEISQEKVRLRLANLYYKRAYEVLGLPDEEPLDIPISTFLQSSVAILRGGPTPPT